MSIHDRTIRIAPGWTPQEANLSFSSEVASTASGQIAALTMVGVVSRMATSVRVTGPDHDLLVFGANNTLHGEIRNELNKLRLKSKVETKQPTSSQINIGLGAGNWRGPSIDHDLTLHPESNPGSTEAWGCCPPDQAIAAGLLAGWRTFLEAPTHRELVPTIEQRVELPWDPIDPVLLSKPTLLIGGGGLGANYAHFLPWLTGTPNLSIVDHDTIGLSNLNRCLPFSLDHVNTGFKAQVLKDHIHSAGGSGEAFPNKFAEIADTIDLNGYSRVILAANEDRVGDLLAVHLPKFVITGSMNQDWTASASRHLAGHATGCAACMWPPRPTKVKANCGEGQDTNDPQAPLGALPFLAPLNALASLALSGQREVDTFNRVALEFGTPYPRVRSMLTQSRGDCICSQL